MHAGCVLTARSFEITEGILKNQKIIIGLDSFSYQRLIYLATFELQYLVVVSTILMKVVKLQ